MAQKSQRIKALEYVKNTGGGATKENFIDDWEPIGETLWTGLFTDGLVRINADGKIYLTALGVEAEKAGIEIIHIQNPLKSWDPGDFQPPA